MKKTGLGFGGVLFIVFLILKLVGTISWSWWWVTAPLWIPFGLSIVIIVIADVLYPTELKEGIKEALKDKK